MGIDRRERVRGISAVEATTRRLGQHPQGPQVCIPDCDRIDHDSCPPRGVDRVVQVREASAVAAVRQKNEDAAGERLFPKVARRHGHGVVQRGAGPVVGGDRAQREVAVDRRLGEVRQRDSP